MNGVVQMVMDMRIVENKEVRHVNNEDVVKVRRLVLHKVLVIYAIIVII